MAARASLHVPSHGLDTPNSVQSEGTRPRTDFDSSTLARYALASGDISAPLCSALAAPAVASLRMTVSGECLRGGFTETATFPFSVQSE